MKGSSPDILGTWFRALITISNQKIPRAKAYGKRTSRKGALELQHSSPRGSRAVALGQRFRLRRSRMTTISRPSQRDYKFDKTDRDVMQCRVAEVGQGGVTDTRNTGLRHQRLHGRRSYTWPWRTTPVEAVPESNAPCQPSRPNAQHIPTTGG